MATLSIKDEQLFQIKAHMAMLGIKKYSVWIDYILDDRLGILEKEKKDERQ